MLQEIVQHLKTAHEFDHGFAMVSIKLEDALYRTRAELSAAAEKLDMDNPDHAKALNEMAKASDAMKVFEAAGRRAYDALLTSAVILDNCEHLP